MRRLACALAWGMAGVVGLLPQPAPTVIDALVVDASGRPITSLGAGDFSVTVDGAPRRVLGARFVFRGPEADARAAETQDRGTGVESSRAVLVVVDEHSLPPGAERTAATAVNRLLDRLGSADRVALVPIPARRDSLALATDRTPIRQALSRLVGRARPVDMLARGDETGAPTSLVADAANPKGRGDEPAQARPTSLGDPAVSPDAVRERPLDTLASLVTGLTRMPGPKTVVLATGGLALGGQAGGQVTPEALRNEIRRVETAAAAARVVLYVVGLQTPSNAGSSWSELEQLAQATGGACFRPSRSVDAHIERLVLALSGFYTLEVDAAAGDGDGRPHAVRVSTNRPNLAVRFGHQWQPRQDPALVYVPPPPRPAEDGGRKAGSASRGRGPDGGRRDEWASTPELEAAMSRVRDYIAVYRRDLANIVAEEDYFQTVTGTHFRQAFTQARRLKSDFLMVTSPEGISWIPFRDVFEVDGRPVRDRDDRLRKLFLETSPGFAQSGVEQIQAEAARYNLGSARRSLNVPVRPLEFLLAENIGRFRFRRTGEDTINGVRAWRVDYEETERPTLTRGTNNIDLPATGAYWVDPATGAILKTLLRHTHPGVSAYDRGLTMEMTVTYRRHETLSLWIPAEMREAYRQATERIEAIARYSNIRTFQVRTAEQIKDPKK